MTLPRPHSCPWPLGRSETLAARARAHVAGFTMSMMKKPEHFAPGRFPVFLESGRGPLVRDVDGNEYIDFICGLGASALGHDHPVVREAILATLDVGVLHSLPHELELRAADALLAIVPNGEMVRFFKTGADATSCSVRLARALTGRSGVFSVGYHGWHDHFMFDTPGVPPQVAELSRRFPLFQKTDEEPLLDAIRKSEDVAVCLLAVPYNRQLERPFLEALRAECTAAGVLLVFDEIVTGLRVALGGVQELFGVTPDLSTYSKALGAGMPISAVVGPREHMAKLNELQVSTTFGGEMLSLAVCEAAIETYRKSDTIGHIARLGRRLRDGINEVSEGLETPLRIVGYDPLPFFKMAPDPISHVPLGKELQAQMAQRGVILRRDLNFICAAHDEESIDHAIEACAESLRVMRDQGVFAP